MRFSSLAALKAFLLLITAVSIEGFWRMPCLSRSGLARIDPLVSFGSVSEHAHAIHGSSGMFPLRLSDLSIYVLNTSQTISGLCPKMTARQPMSQYHANIYGLAFSETATYDVLVAGECTSCQVSEDKSAYWTPALYFQHADTGDYELVQQVGGMLA